MKQDISQDITQAELVIMKLLWEESPSTAQQINEQVQKLQKEKSWRKATVKTLINRLLKKGFVDFEQEGRRYLYVPMLEKSSYLADQNDRFLNDLYDGDLSHMMAAFTQHERLSEVEIKEIKALIAKLENDHE